MKKTKQQKGITLIALIITIVVLLILAVVAIGAVQDSNIVGYAQNAAGGYNSAKAKETNALSGYENIVSQYVNGISSTGSSGENNGEGNSVENLGKYVKYDSNGDGSVADETILWRVLRDDSNEVELITADVLGNVDLTSTSFDTSRSNYNKSVSLMIKECIEVTGINSVRNVGGPTVDKTEIVNFEELAKGVDFNPTVDISNFNKYEGENGFIVGEEECEEEWNQLLRAGVAEADNSQQYWLASRSMYVYNDTVYFGVHSIFGGGFTYTKHNFCNVDSSANSSYSAETRSFGVRPVLTLEGGILEGKAGSGTKDNPIEIY